MERKMNMNENRAGLGYQNFEEVRTGRIFEVLETKNLKII